MDKPESRLGYESERTQTCRQLLITLVRKLGPWRNKLILVGGLVPYLLFEDGDHAGTTDIDLVINPTDVEDVESYRTLEQNFRKIGLRRGISLEGQAQHFRWTISDHEGRETASLDLLCPSSEGEAGKVLALKDFGEKRLSAIGIPGARLVFDDYQEIELRGELLGGQGKTRVKVRIVGLVAYVVLKALAFKERGESKDAYDLIYVLMRAGPEKLGQAFGGKMSDNPNEPLYPEAVTVLKDSFLDDEEVPGVEKEGPVQYARFVEPTDPDEQAIAAQDAAGVAEIFLRAASKMD
ncbi:MAG: hypothetical protein KC800_00345 [Candidatus Eremiobacteraeota bacterium]|nr:hypothetical protein [Candidatus Eremiobacteraeota bacterium]|tara:strand:- start:1418 stop:2299 length:882 start_codon:yes stop_codon:yes gene_type:complete